MTKSIHHSFDIELAEEFGIPVAILIHHFQHWINHNQLLNKNFKDGRTWSYQTRKEIAAWFPYISEDQVRRITDKLVEDGVLIKGNYNRSGYDKTIWYAFENEEKFTNGKSANGHDKSANGHDKSAKPIPDTKTDTETNTELFVANDPVGPSLSKISKISIKDHKGNETIIDESMFYRQIVLKRVSWSSDAISYAWETLSSYHNAISDWWAFIEGTVNKYQNLQKSKHASKDFSKKKQHNQVKNKNIDQQAKETVEEEQNTQPKKYANLAEALIPLGYKINIKKGNRTK